ncbi:MAG TPA: BrnT family toxin [Sedimenticola sp.]|nr:BrnT family toxin [Sedimenticola sp.]
MRFEWDEAKRLANIQKHGIDFVGCKQVFEGVTLSLEDGRVDYGEQRFITFGFLEGRVVSVVHTEDVDTIRIISIRKATKHEQESFFNHLPN